MLMVTARHHRESQEYFGRMRRLGRESKNPGYAPTPGNLHEYKRKGLTKFAIRKSLILKDAILVVLGLQQAEMWIEKEKREQAPALQNPVIYKTKCSTN
jgi:hypothetical protein